MKKIIAGCLFLVLCCSSVQATETVTKTLSPGEWVVKDVFGQFISYDCDCATILKYYKMGTVRICKDIPVNIYFRGIGVKLQYMQYNGDPVLHVTYNDY